jgi:hypothetical protein
MTRPWKRPRFVPAVLAAACLLGGVAAPAPVRAGLVETSMLTEQSARLTGQSALSGPDWSPTRTGVLPTPSGSAPSPAIIRGRGSRAPEPPPRVPRPASGAPGTVAGLVYERGTQAPIANVSVTLVSTEPQYIETTLTARTDSAGYYEFAAVEPGLWRLSIQRDGLPMTWAVPRLAPALSVAKKEKIAIPPFALGKQACVAGKAAWSDGYTLFDAPVTVIPASPDLGAAGGMLNGIGDYTVCEAPEDSVMVWMHLRDGRSLGRSTRLVAGTPSRVDFKPDPLEKMEGSPLRVLPVLSDGTPVPRAQIIVVGRRFEQGPRPALVFVREEASDAVGVAEFKVPFGNYEVLVMNPRQGQTGSQRMVVDIDQTGNIAPLRVELTGAKNADERAALKRSLLERAERSLTVWTQ